jgi:hypothetical protein
MARDNGIISLGKQWYEFPPEYWGSADRAKAAAFQPRELGNLAAVTPLPQLAGGWFRSKPRRGSNNATSRAVDALLEDIGVRPRRVR